MVVKVLKTICVRVELAFGCLNTTVVNYTFCCPQATVPSNLNARCSSQWLAGTVKSFRRQNFLRRCTESGKERLKRDPSVMDLAN